MRILTKFLTISLMAVALSACGDKQENGDNQTPTPTKPSTLLSENSSTQEIVKAMAGSWTYCSSSEEKGNSLWVSTEMRPNADFTALEIPKITMIGYYQINCQGDMAGKEEHENLGLVNIISKTKGVKQLEGMDSDYLDLQVEVATASGSKQIQQQALSFDGTKLLDYNRNKIVMIKQ